MILISNLVFVVSVWAAPVVLGLPPELEAKVWQAVQQKCSYVAVESARTKDYVRGDQSLTDMIFDTTIEVKYYYDSHPVVGSILVESTRWDVYGPNQLDTVNSITSNSVGLCN